MTDWLRNAATPERRVKIAGWILIFCLFAWPASSLTVFSSASPESQGILALSWLALIGEALLLIVTTDIRAEQEEDA